MKVSVGEEGRGDLEVLLVIGFFFQAEDGIRDLVRSRGLGDVYKRQLDRTVTDTKPRSNVVGTFRGRGTGRSMILFAHADLSLIHI